MENFKLFKRAFIIALLLLPGLVMAQHYNNLHRFATDYTRSVNTCAIHLNGSKIVEGGTIRNSNTSLLNSVELGIVDPVNGTLLAHPFFYSFANHNHTAADLIESLGDPGHVVCAANMNSLFATSNMVSVFKTDPSSGAVDWSLVYKSSNGSQIARAITRDNNKNYYILGDARFSGRSLLYLIKVDDSGSPIWERYYAGGTSFASALHGVDLIFDGTSVVLVADHTSSAVDPSGRGLVIAQINPATGAVTNARNLQHLNGNRELKARDIAQVGSRYVIVGEYHPNPIGIATPQLGFMVTYDAALNVAATRIYGDPFNNNMRVTGVRPDFFGNLYMSYDLGTDERTAWLPGFMQTNAVGKVNSASIYRVKGYLGTNGLISVTSFLISPTYMIKGSVNSASIPGAPSLSLIGDGPSITIDPNICQDRYEIKNEEVKYESVVFGMFVDRDETADKVELKGERIRGRSYNCLGTVIGSFRMARPAAIEEADEETGVAIYPNPSSGKFTIQLDAEQAADYQRAEILDLMGKTVATFNINSTNLSVDLSDQVPGIYLLRLKSSDGHVSKTQRMMIR